MLLTGPKKGMSRMPGVAKFGSPTVPCHFCDPTIRLGGSKLAMSAFGNDSGLLKKIVRMADIYLVKGTKGVTTVCLPCCWRVDTWRVFLCFSALLLVPGSLNRWTHLPLFRGKVG